MVLTMNTHPYEQDEELVKEVLSEISLKQLLDMNTLQTIQENLANITGISMVTVDYKGRPITKETSFSSFCVARREIQSCKDNCFFSDAYGGLKAAMLNAPYLYYCPAGLVDCAVPIVVQDNHLGAVLMGQVRCADESTALEKIEQIVSNEINLVDFPDLQEKFYETKKMSISELERAAHLVQYLVNEMVEKQIGILINQELGDKNECLNVTLSLKNNEIRQLEESKSKISDKDASSFVMSALSLVNNIAILEGADQTSELVNLYTNMFRAGYESPNKLIPLQMEFDFLETFVNHQKAFFKIDFDCQIELDSSLLNERIPAHILYPIVENAIIHGLLPVQHLGKLLINAVRNQQGYSVEISDNGIGMSKSAIQHALHGSNTDSSKILKSIDLHVLKRRLQKLYPDQENLMEVSNNPAGHGTIVKILIPKT